MTAYAILVVYAEAEAGSDSRTSDVMTRAVTAVQRDTPVADAIRLMLDKGISGLPVLDPAGALMRIVTEDDFLRRAELGTEERRPCWLRFLLGPGREAGEFVRTHGRKVEEVMTRDVQSATEDTPLGDIGRFMERFGIKRAPIVRAGRLVGIVSRVDLLKALKQCLTDEAAPDAVNSTAAEDAAIEQRILDELARQSWAPRAALTISADHGTVTLQGITSDERERQALRVLAENVPGVTAVRGNCFGSSRPAAWRSSRRRTRRARLMSWGGPDPTPALPGIYSGSPAGANGGRFAVSGSGCS